MTEAADTLIALSLGDQAPQVQPTSSASTIASSPVPIPPCCCECHNRKPELVTQCTQTDKRCDPSLLAVKIENITLKHEIVNLKQKLETSKDDKAQSNFGANVVRDDDVKCKFYTGLTWLQFMCLWEFLGPAKEKLAYWNQPLKTGGKSPSKRPGVKRKHSPMDELFITLVRLRVGLLNLDLAYRCGVSVSSVSKIVTTWVQFLYIQFGRLRPHMFPSRDILKLSMPPCFNKFKNIRVIIDCCEFFVQQSMHFKRQGNLYSSYKHHSTYKCLVGIAPNGCVMFVSDAFEGSMSDNEIVKQSGFLEYLQPAAI